VDSLSSGGEGTTSEEETLQTAKEESAQKIRDVWIDNFFVELQRITACIQDNYNYVAMVSLRLRSSRQLK
jgi:hypothetical protein